MVSPNLAAPAAPARILIVDDHPHAASVMARALGEFDVPVEVLTASSGPEALTLIGRGAVDVLITDFMMPSLNGLELIEKLRHSREPTYTILVTAYDSPGLVTTARQLKVDDYLVKPVSPDRLRTVVSRALGGLRLAAADHFNPGDFKILVADDRADNVHLLVTRLAAEGYVCLVAADGEDALAQARAHAPDLVLLDVNMPKRSGFEVLAEMRRAPPLAHVPVILITAARATARDVLEGFGVGADDYMVKPFDGRELSARVRAKLRVKRAEDALRRRNRELEVLPEIGRELTEPRTVEQLAEFTLSRCASALCALHGHLVIFHSDGSLLHKFQPHESLPWASASVRERLSAEGVVAHIVATRMSVLITDAPADPRWLKTPGDSTLSALAAPLLTRRGVLGVLTLTHDQRAHFNEGHLRLLQGIVSQAAIAIENAQFYAAVAQEEQRLEAVLRGVADAILVLDAERRLRLLNPAAQRLLSLSGGEARLGQTLPSSPACDDLLRLFERAQRSRTVEQGEIQWPDPAQPASPCTLAALLTPLDDNRLVAVLHDVTHFKALECVKNEFIAAASHDLKNPITAMMAYADLLSKSGPLSERQTEYVSRMRKAAKHMHNLVLDLMELARIDLGQPLRLLPCALGDLLSNVVDEFQPQAAAKAQTLRLRPPEPPLPPVLADEARLRQVVSNLLCNALKYTPAGGAITVAAEAAGDGVRVQVRDTGLGIPPADLPFVFNKFYRVGGADRAEIEGNGLGLAIVKAIVEQHGGQVGVESAVGQGSCFSFTLRSPSSPPPALPANDRADLDQAFHHGGS